MCRYIYIYILYIRIYIYVAINSRYQHSSCAPVASARFPGWLPAWRAGPEHAVAPLACHTWRPLAEATVGGWMLCSYDDVYLGILFIDDI